ncbi:cytochrome c oxidase subunit VI [Dictyostelium discoideum AX4]|uniref:Cytochrome c oxidase polypeptide 6, mitochondrial n=1 Tax=Dictyostelium discoideum TaxID=44689 RepID=COX6_DICDI|nr:cytochrome c oxidase subunit VI [Dictyostelium discoideum AX4]P26310.2 RecName: Full=Cytochrome c oxidase polypeptide 6, mitochondrial; AltName: Full=Cytochrome c oxidase polypeptide VI [Dictyostelium discoideum]EAL66374.1 cytochrome c oxidase subunit VI [Dictyostelium discoideum AX4]CAA39207.1 cytochrome c oxidase subunit VI [Dictyostelium discoideum]|eukprot:XP_640351.1 cytochrome c oxidase subunit VI [Dictyostelium discoideum AX4]
MSTGNESYNLRYPKGFKGYPYNMYKLEGYGTPKGYITLIGVVATLTVSGLFFAKTRSNKREYPTHNKEWRAKTLAYAKETNADPIYQLPKDKI